MKIRKAEIKDFDVLYKLGLATSEFRLNDRDPFMSPEEFELSIQTPSGLMLVAEEQNEILGFIYSNWEYPKNPEISYLVYLVVISKYRNKGVAQKLYDETVSRLKKQEIKYLYVWVNAKSSSIFKFMKKNGFDAGSQFIWMGKNI